MYFLKFSITYTKNKANFEEEAIISLDMIPAFITNHGIVLLSTIFARVSKSRNCR
jgi:hypothetical protein